MARADRLFAGAVVPLTVVVSCRRIPIWFTIWVWLVGRFWFSLMMIWLSVWPKLPRRGARVGLSCFDGGLGLLLRPRNWSLPTRSFLRHTGACLRILRSFNLRFGSRLGPRPRGSA